MISKMNKVIVHFEVLNCEIVSIFTASGSTHESDKIYRKYLQSAQRLHVHAEKERRNVEISEVNAG